MKKILVTEFDSIGGKAYNIIPLEDINEEGVGYYNNISPIHMVLEVSEEKAKEMFEIQGKHIHQQVELAMKMHKAKGRG